MSIDNPVVIDYDHGISTIDTEYVAPGVDASHLLVDNGEAALVDVGTNHSIPVLMSALEQKGIAPEQVRYVLITHVHLDHAGGAGKIMTQLPNATLVAHPRAARHIIDPSRLVEGATAVYGEEAMARQFGKLLPVPEERVQIADDGHTLMLGKRKLLFLDTPGHAYHHYSVVDNAAGVIFPGDTFGLSYRALDTDRGAFICPTTTPVHFDPEAAHRSIDRLMSYKPRAMFVAHFGRLDDLQRLAADLHHGIDALVEIARRHEHAGEQRYHHIHSDMRAWLLEGLRAHGCKLDEQRIDNLMAMDLDLNTMGLEVWLDRQAD